MNTPTPNIPSDAVAALDRDSKIEAIKIVRMANHIDLKDAKDLIEQYINANPAIKARMDATNAATAKGSMKWVLIIAVIAAVVYYMKQ